MHYIFTINKITIFKTNQQILFKFSISDFLSDDCQGKTIYVHTNFKLCTESILNCTTVGNNQDLLRHHPEQYGNDIGGCWKHLLLKYVTSIAQVFKRVHKKYYGYYLVS